MGSFELRQKEAILRKLKQIEQKQGYEFKMLKNSINFMGVSDFYTKRAIVYRENYLEEMKKYQGYDNYDILMKKLNSFTNPNEFYEFVSKNEITKDLTYQSDEVYSQTEFNAFINDLFGEDVVDGDDLVKDFMNFKFSTKSDENIEF